MSLRTGWGAPERPSSCTLKYFIFELHTDCWRRWISYQFVILVLTKQDHFCFVHAELCMRDRGDGRPYFKQSCWTWLLHVEELFLHIIRIYLTILCTVRSGLDQILWKSINALMCSDASTGRSPSRKYSAGTGEDWLSLRKPRKTLL